MPTRPWVDSSLKCGNILAPDAQVRRDVGRDRGITREGGKGWAGRQWDTPMPRSFGPSQSVDNIPRSLWLRRAWPCACVSQILSGLVWWLTTEYTNLEHGAMKLKAFPSRTRKLGASGPFIIDAGGKRDGVVDGVASGGRRLRLHFALCTLHRKAEQGSRRSTSDVKTARQTLFSVTLVTHASSTYYVALGEPTGCWSI